MRSENICVVDDFNIQCAAVPFENRKDMVYPVRSFYFMGQSVFVYDKCRPRFLPATVVSCIQKEKCTVVFKHQADSSHTFSLLFVVPNISNFCPICQEMILTSAPSVEGDKHNNDCIIHHLQERHMSEMEDLVLRQNGDKNNIRSSISQYSGRTPSSTEEKYDQTTCNTENKSSLDVKRKKRCRKEWEHGSRRWTVPNIRLPFQQWGNVCCSCAAGRYQCSGGRPPILRIVSRRHASMESVLIHGRTFLECYNSQTFSGKESNMESWSLLKNIWSNTAKVDVSGHCCWLYSCSDDFIVVIPIPRGDVSCSCCKKYEKKCVWLPVSMDIKKKGVSQHQKRKTCDERFRNQFKSTGFQL